MSSVSHSNEEFSNDQKNDITEVENQHLEEKKSICSEIALKRNSRRKNSRKAHISASVKIKPTTYIELPIIPERPPGLLEKHRILSQLTNYGGNVDAKKIERRSNHSVRTFTKVVSNYSGNLHCNAKLIRSNSDLLKDSLKSNLAETRGNTTIIQKYMEENNDLIIQPSEWCKNEESEMESATAEIDSIYVGPVKSAFVRNSTSALVRNNNNIVNLAIRKSNRIALRKSAKIFEKRRLSHLLINQEYEDITKYESKHSLVSLDVGTRKSKLRDKAYNYYNHNKVMLKDSEGKKSTFYPAAFINNFKGQRKIIATQTPIKTGVDDFWKMCLTQNVHFIFSFVDYDQKDDTLIKFWPRNGKPRQYRNMTVTTVEKKDGRNMIKRKVRISINGGVIDINIVIYTKWSSFKIPEDFNAMGMLVEDMKFLIEDFPNERVVIMCETGQNQSAVFIAAYLCLQEIELTTGFDMVKVATHVKDQLPRAFNRLVHYRILNSFMMRACNNLINIEE